MKKLVTLLLTISMALICLSGCKQQETAYANKLEEIQAKGVLVLATSPDYAPMEFIDPNKSGQEQYVGSDIALAKYIAEALGVTLEIKAMDFDAVLTAISTDNADIAISGFGWKQEREDNYELSIGYNQDGESSCQGLMVKADQVENYKTLADFNGKKIVAQPGSLQEGYVKEQIEGAEITLMSTLDAALMMLKTDKVDGFACSCDQIYVYQNSNPDLAKATPEFDTTLEDMHAGNVLAVKKGETELIAKINEILAQVNESGIYQTWSDEAKAIGEALGMDFEE
jgi:polar amino acid transport system substrate-binding protein